jgi:hypothetical protein
MAARRRDEPVRLIVEGGATSHFDAIVVADLRGNLSLPDGARVWLVENSDEGRPGSTHIPGQLDDTGRLVWLLAGETPAGIRRTFTVEMGAEAPINSDIRIVEHPAILVVGHAGRPIAHYNYASVWKPYLWPLNGPAGNVVRGASAEHQHQAGLFFSYGGHFTPTNIWSDWDEPIYGPDGKMLHQEFERLVGGPVFAEMIERIGYMAADGTNILDERRSIRLYPLPDGTTVVDFARTCARPAELSDGPFSLAARVADPLRTVDNSRRGPPPDRTMLPTEPPGKMESAGGESTHGENLQSERWLDRSGALPGGWGGLAFLDFPGNPGYPGRIDAAGYGTLMLSYRFPEDLAVATWRYRVVAHAGDAGAARIEERWQDYASPLNVTVAE